MSSRFSKEDKDRLVKVPDHTSWFAIFVKNVGIFIDFGFFILLLLWDLTFFISQSNFLIFLVGHIILLVINIVLLYYIFIKFNRIEVIKYDIPLKNIKKEFKFVFVSDIHAGHRYASSSVNKFNLIIYKINSINSDLVILGGDLLSYKLDEEFIRGLDNIKANQVLAVYGNHDSYYIKNKFNIIPDKLIEIFKNETKIKLLLNSGISISNGIDNFFIGGIPDLYSKEFDIEETFKDAPTNSRKILVSHNPDVIDFVEDKDSIDLILSGHNHSGQIYIKPIGAILPMPTKRRWLTRGVFKIGNNTKLFLSQGVGNNGSRLRIGTKNEICIINLKPENN